MFKCHQVKADAPDRIGSSANTLSLGSKRSGTRFVKNLTRYRRFPTVLRRILFYQVLCTGLIN